MSKRFTDSELLAELHNAQDGTRAVHEQDGPRNAAIFAGIETTVARFASAPHAFPEPPTLDDALSRVGEAYRVADAYRVVYGSALADLNTADARTIDYAHRAASQYTAALEQLTWCVSDARVALYALLPVMPAETEGARA